MIRKRAPLYSILILVLIPFAWSQTQTNTVTLKGTVAETTLLSNNDLHVWLQSDRLGSEVCLGSANLLDDQGLRPQAGDTIEVTGVRVGNGSLLVADSLQMAGKTVTLRRASASQDCPNCGCGHCGHHSNGRCNHGCYGCNRARHGRRWRS